jgi:hypothetical protein
MPAINMQMSRSSSSDENIVASCPLSNRPREGSGVIVRRLLRSGADAISFRVATDYQTDACPASLAILERQQPAMVLHDLLDEARPRPVPLLRVVM